MTFNERFEQLLEEKHLKKAAVADALDLRKQLLTDWKNNGNLPRSDIAIKLAKFLGVSIDYLLTGEQHKSELSFEDAEILEKYHDLSDVNKEFLLNTLNMLWEKEKK